MILLADSIVRWYRNPQWYQAILSAGGIFVSLLLAYIAIFGKDKFLKLRFSYSVSKIDQNIAGGELVQFWRIKLTNSGTRKATDVVVQIVKILDYKKGKYFERQDFIHIPLHWTHYDSAQRRTIAVNEDAFVDIGTYDLFDPKLRLSTNPQNFTSNLSEIGNNAKIYLRVSDASGYVEEIVLTYKMEFSGADIRMTKQKIIHSR